MEEISVDEFEKRAKDLIRKWQIDRKNDPDLKIKRLNFDVETILIPLQFITYIIATIYYSSKLNDRNATKEEEKLNEWAEKSANRILSLLTSLKIDNENYMNDMQDLTKIMKRGVDEKNFTSTSDVVSDKTFEIVQKYCPDAESRDRELIDYVVRAELARLKK